MNRDDLPLPAPPAEAPPDTHSGFMARFRNYFLTGLIVAGPIAITFYLTWWFVTWVDGLVRPFVPVAYRPETYLPFGLPGSGLIVAVIALTLLGFLTANLIGRTLVDLGERLLGRMPVVVIAPFDRVFEKTVSNMQEVAARGGNIILMTDAKGAAEATIESLVTIVLPDMAATFTPMVYAVPVQLLAYHTAVIMGTDVDQPRNLAKSVTVE